jgi:hypothetical protein
MTDPVRPVAPREDELRQLIAVWQARATVWSGQKRGKATTLRLCADELESLLAAAPVPCAASLADPRVADLLADLRTVESVYQKDRVAHVYASTIEKIFDKWLYDDEPDPPRATGEGARDAQKTSQEMPHVHSGPSDADHVARWVVGNDAVRDLQAGDDRAGQDETAPSDRQAAPVAVSLDPHLWIHARIDDLKDSAIAGFKNHDARLIALETELARLRGEATVRPVDRFEVIDETGRLLTRKPVNVELSYQDDGRTLKVFLKRAPATVRVEE